MRSLAVLFLVTWTLATAHADEPQPTDQARASAAVLLQSGNDLLDAGDLLGALDLFRSAYRTYPSPWLHINIGTTLWNLGRFAEAEAELELALAAPEVPEDKKVELRANLAEIAREVATLVVKVEPADSVVVLDGLARDLIDGVLRARVDQGMHTLSVEADGRRTVRRTLGLATGTYTLRLELLPEIVLVDPQRLRSTARRFGATAAVIGVYGELGAAASIGVSWGAWRWVEIAAGANLGIQRAAWASATASPFGRRFHPLVSLGISALDEEGVYLGVRGSGGVEWRVTDQVALESWIGVERYFSVPDDREDTLVIAGVGVHLRR